MHLAPGEILHVYEAGNRRAEVQRVAEKQTPFRVVFQTKKAGEIMPEGESPYWTHAPHYCESEEDAKDRAKRWAYRGNQ